ncbi:DeoR family transcriptional regulator [Escherichia coli]|nr:DeoR family transcriptional regulator [Escherichia coli]
MTEAQRHQIPSLEMLAQTGFASEFAEKVVDASGNFKRFATARRDINKLDESGKLKKVRNGAAKRSSQQRPVLDADESASGAESR